MDNRFSLTEHPDATLVFNLNWRPSPSPAEPCDLDIGCLYVLEDGRRGTIQAAGGYLGEADRPPFIALLRDDPDGREPDGETLTLTRPEHVAFAVVFAMIYRGVSDFRTVGATLTMTHPGLEAPIIELASPDPGLRWCALAVCGSRDGDFMIVPQQRYFLSARHAAEHYGISLDWKVGLKSLDSTLPADLRRPR